MVSLWMTRSRQRIVDFGDILSFSFYPFASCRTMLNLGGGVPAIQLEMWPGRSVGSGGFVWGAARRLASHLRLHGDGCAADPAGAFGATEGRSWDQVRVLELGAGTGALGLAARALGAKSVTITDQAHFCFPGQQQYRPGAEREEEAASGLGARSLLDLMAINVQLNERSGDREEEPAPMLPKAAAAPANPTPTATTRAPPSSPPPPPPPPSSPSSLPPPPLAPPLTGPLAAVQVHELLWGAEAMMSRLPHESYDLICGADILLFTSAHADLVATLKDLSRPSTVVLIEHTDRGGQASGIYPRDLRLFVAALADGDGAWAATVVRDHGRHILLRLVRTRAGVDAPFSAADFPARVSLA